MLANFSVHLDVCNSDKILKDDGHPPYLFIDALMYVILNWSQEISP